ncbi:hypothetical protein PR002_g28096 [Phytophthora rubi]|uniref:No apical meristem-associated C-terminal domain-containing protein n=1 Tax=Phytophthora rubi TaxID=129364 RepID=A0A6A3HEY4_9STRA|nr:hypothetical protein PR002_g28096 [Phytophthora rubi]
MHVKKGSTRRSKPRSSSSDSDAVPTEDLDDNATPVSVTTGVKRKSNAERPVQIKKTSRTSLNEASSPLIEDNSVEDEAELQLLAIEARRLDFEVSKWKQQQKLRRETLQLKAEEISLKEATTRQTQQTQVMELKAKVLKALDKVGTTPAQARKYLALLEG